MKLPPYFTTNFLPHRRQRSNPDSKAGPRFAAPGFDARNEVFLIGDNPPRLGSCVGGDEVWMPHHEPNFVRIEAQMQCRGMVILTDTWFPGWRATVDGKRAKIERAYGMVRGVVVDPGNHTIEMRYRPWSVYVGAALSLLAAGIVTGVVRRNSVQN